MKENEKHKIVLNRLKLSYLDKYSRKKHEQRENIVEFDFYAGEVKIHQYFIRKFFREFIIKKSKYRESCMN